MDTWKLELEGSVYYETDLSFRDAEHICDHLKVPFTWAEMNPLRTPAHLMAICATFLSRKREISFADALELVKSWPVNKTVGALEKVDDDDRPTTYQDGNPLTGGRTTAG